MKAEVVVEGLRFPEGPVWCPDGTVVCTSIADGALHRVWPELHRQERIASTGGGANGAALAGDGGFVVTQNGGLDYAASATAFERIAGLEWLAVPFRDLAIGGSSPVTPGLQRVRPDGTVEFLLQDGFRAPNDLVVGADGTVYFTDPPHGGPGEHPRGRVWSWQQGMPPRLLADGLAFPNGIGLDADGFVVIVEKCPGERVNCGLLRLLPDGTTEWAVEYYGGGDGFCVDLEGNFYCALLAGHGVQVVSPAGEPLELLELPGRGLTTNCCFGGPDRRWLFATDSVPGSLVVWTDLPVAGAPLHAWPVPGSSAPADG